MEGVQNLSPHCELSLYNGSNSIKCTSFNH